MYDKYCLKTKEKPQQINMKENTYCLICKKKTDNKNIVVALKKNRTTKISVC